MGVVTIDETVPDVIVPFYFLFFLYPCLGPMALIAHGTTGMISRRVHPVVSYVCLSSFHDWCVGS